MTNHPQVENLPAITSNSIPVVTNEFLARLYSTERQRLTNNFSRNKERFVEGKHYFMAKGEALENLKNSLRGFQTIAPNVRKLILWTERGAARHAKMLETDQAWEVFEKLEDCYFNQSREVTPAFDLLNIDLHLCIRDGEVMYVRSFKPEKMVAVEDALSILRKKGWIVMPKDELAQRLLEL